MDNIEHDPVYRAFMDAPEDDEPTTAEDIADLNAARAEYERGETVSHSEAMAILNRA